MLNSKENQLLERCAGNLQQDAYHSQVLFKFDQEEKSLEKAKKIVENLGVKIVDIKIFDFPEESVSLIKLNFQLL